MLWQTFTCLLSEALRYIFARRVTKIGRRKYSNNRAIWKCCFSWDSLNRVINYLDRKLSLHNLRILWPELAIYVNIHLLCCSGKAVHFRWSGDNIIRRDNSRESNSYGYVCDCNFTIAVDEVKCKENQFFWWFQWSWHNCTSSGMVGYDNRAWFLYWFLDIY